MFFQKREISLKDDYYCGSLTLLHLAVRNRDIKTARLLLEHNANVNAKTRLGESHIVDLSITPMDMAVLKDDISMKYLLSEFGGVSSKDEESLQSCNYFEIIQV